MNEKCLVTVIIPTYGGAPQLKRAIFSVINQTFTNLEIFVVDDNDPDSDARKRTEKIIASFNDKRLVYFRHEKNMNGAAARNTGLAAAQGKYICFLDDDDFYFPERVKDSVDTLEKNPDCDAVLCGVLDCTDSGQYGVRYHYTKDGNLKNELLTRKTIMGSGSNIFITARSAKILDSFDVNFLRLQDDEFMIRFYKKFKACVNDRLLIVKSRNGINNEPALKKLYKSRELFFNKYKEDIEHLTDEEKYDFYNYHYTSILNAAFYDKGGPLKDLVIAKVKEIRLLTKKERLQLFLLKYELGKKIVFLYSKCNILGKMKEKELSSRIKNDCTKEEQSFISKYLEGDFYK